MPLTATWGRAPIDDRVTSDHLTYCSFSATSKIGASSRPGPG